MRRRSVLVGGALALLIAPKPSVSQQTQAKIPRVGVLTQASSNRAPMFDAFREGLRDLGYVEGSNIIIEFRFAGGDLSRGAELAAELGSIPVDVIVNEGVSGMDPNGRIPIVSPVMVDPVGFGLAASLARPGGNVTGFTLMTTELNGKRVELLRDAFPAITMVAALVNPAQATHKMAFAQTESAAQSLGLKIVRRVEAQNVQALRALHPEVYSGADAVIVQTDRPDAPESFMSLFRGCPALRVVAIDGDCSRGFLHELRPHSIRLPALSAEVLQSALQGQITMGDQRYRSK